jgi:bifunctional non-homologous end joining protein LigD
MALEKYNQKRDFKKTPEPSGKPAKSKAVKKTEAKGLRFVIQKHQASRLHFDFRIEVDGVMKSWAVPKGPSLNPTDKRLAMMVEDHPMDYRNFEGTIPEGNYGAGTVMLWDEGTYHSSFSEDPQETQKLVNEQLESGDIKLTLHGEKLKGEFALVRMKKAGENGWLLIKHKDEFANQAIVNEDKSVRTGRTLDEITAAGGDGSMKEPGKSPKGKSAQPAKRKVVDVNFRSAPKTDLPTEVVPMLATLVDKPFDHPDWLFEIKWDGYRAIAEIAKPEDKSTQVKLYSRNNISFNKDYPDLIQELEQFPEMVLDGEIVVMDSEGRAKFQLMQQYRQTGKGNLRFYVFDILYYGGHDLRSLTLEQRKEILAQVVPETDLIRISEAIPEKGEALFKLAAKQGVEGIIAKNSYSKYSTGVRGDDWLKIKLTHQQEVVIGGYTEPKGTRDHFGALMLGVYEKKKLKYAGLVGTGFDSHKLKDLKTKLDAIKTAESPFVGQPDVPNVAQWVEPQLVAEVQFNEWTDEGLLRQASFLGLREDKNPLDVKREQPEEVEDIEKGKSKKDKSTKTTAETTTKKIKQSSKTKTSDSDPANIIPGVPLSHPDRIYWPRDKYTKLDLITYYRDIAPVMLPYLKDRPQNLNRFPNGINGESFYHKDMEQDLPAFIDTVSVYSESNDKEVNYMICNNVETLMYMGYLACLEINPWNSRAQHLDQPDYLIFDLDPNETKFEKVVETANMVREVLEEIEIVGYPKTSGKDGLHVYIPLAAKYTFDQTQQFAQLIALLVQQRLPEVISLERSPKDRKGKVYIDYLQNRHGQTTAAAYSPRPRDKAPVSTPLMWMEVNKRLDPTKFTIKNILGRLDKLGDLWKPILGKGVDMEKALKQLTNKLQR